MHSTLSPVVVLLVVGLASGSPLITAAPSTASVTVAIVARQAQSLTTPPADFGSETITATSNGTTYTFIHHIGFQLTNDASNNEIIDVAEPLLLAVQSIVQDSSVCAVTPASTRAVRRRDNGSIPVHLEGRDDTVVDLVADACFGARMDEAISQMDMSPAGALAMALPSIGNALSMQDFVATINLAFEMAYARLDSDRFYNWAGVESKRLAIGILGIMMILEAKNIRTQGQYIISQSLFRSEPDDTIECGTDENAAACIESNCHGAQGKCTTAANKDCECWPLLNVSEDELFDPAMYDLQQAMLATADLAIPGNPTCTGIGMQKTISRAAGAIAIGAFCGNAPISNDLPMPWYTQDFNINTDDWVRITLNFGTGYQVSVSDCNAFLLTILDGCDGNNPDNPGNMKHGGSIVYPEGASFDLTPLAGNPTYCNTYRALNWVDIGVGVDAVTQFCTEQSLNGHPGGRTSHEYNAGKPNAVTLTVSYFNDYTMSLADCVSQFRVPLDNCDHNDLVNNPMDNKFGGTFTNNRGVVFVVTPSSNPPVFPPANSLSTYCNTATGGSLSSDDMYKITMQFCKQDAAMYNQQYMVGKTKVLLKADTIDPGGFYGDGTMVCRNTPDWHYQIIASDCQYAFQLLQSHCPKSGGGYYVYHCVYWSFSFP